MALNTSLTASATFLKSLKNLVTQVTLEIAEIQVTAVILAMAEIPLAIQVIVEILVTAVTQVTAEIPVMTEMVAVAAS